ncbi:FecR family protein [Bordetella genomosp. 13]|uniref:Iron dicitrate transport regulator FecR n=1 Tax=Bordetella genomosp. 13 TaxID=463040 RepID=A0A1W6Z854_9BORD|nr:FecR domain-containing protein [Bordetella genomosp. 13]ARP93300.1 hypothetical protein CAL15_02195 [Bordetella genomosp. 13]
MLRNLFAKRRARHDGLESQAHAWIRRLASGRVTEHDLRMLAQWCAQSPEHAGAFADARHQWQLAGQAAAMVKGHLPLSARRPASTPVHAGRRAWLGVAMGAGAAGVAAMVYPPLGLWPAVNEWGADYATATGEQRELALGQALVALNTQTRISVLKAADAGKGMELLSGEAAVDLRSDEPFTVLAAGGQSRSSGTGARFEVRKLDGQICVSCMNGTVTVQFGGRDLLLHANEQVFYDAGGLGRVLPVEARAVSAWREGMLVFRRTALRDVVAEINRYRPGRVVLLDDSKAGELLNGQFRINQLDHALVQISQAFNVKIREAGGLVLLT